MRKFKFMFKNRDQIMDTTFANNGVRRAAFTLSESGRRPLFNSGVRHVAFTLSEILITIAIIGIVSALVIPTLYTNYQQHSWDVGKKKFIKSLMDVTTMMNMNNDFGGLQSSENFATKLTEYLNSAQTCANDSLANCFSEKIVQEDGKTFKSVADYKDAAGLNEIFTSNTVGVKLADGQNMIVAYNPACPMPGPADPTLCLSILYDVNGNKRPNALGKDIHKLNSGDIEQYLAQHQPPSASVPGSTPSGGITDGSDGNGGSTGDEGSGGTGGTNPGGDDGGTTGDNTGGNSGGTTPPAGNLGEGGNSGGSTGGDSGDSGNQSGGNYQENYYTMSDGTILKILAPNIDYQPIKAADNKTIAKKYGVSQLVQYGGNEDDDYWLGAMEACGGPDKMADKKILNKLALELYPDATEITDIEETWTNANLDTQKATPFLSQSPYSDHFSVWSREEYSNDGYYRGYYSDETYRSYTSRYYDTFLAVCIGN